MAQKAVLSKGLFKKYIFALLALLVLSLLLEIFLFNFQSIESLRFEAQDVLSRLQLSENLRETGDHTYTAAGGTVTLTLADWNKPVRSLHLGLETETDRAIQMSVGAVDAGNSQGVGAPARTLWTGEPRAAYLRLHFSGDVQRLWINLELNENDVIRLSGCEINARRPIFFSPGRFLLTWLVLSVLFLLRPKSPLHRYPVNLKRGWQRAALAALALIQIAAFWNLVNINPAFVHSNWPHHYEYQRLTEAFLDGHTYLNEEPPQALIDMENPYDFAERSRVMSETGSDYLWDHAYYNGKYYVYFGVVPVLVFYLPCYALTGAHMQTYIALFIMSLALIFSVLYLLYHIIRRWFPGAPFTLYWILSFLFINSCGIIYILKRPDFYSLPLLMGIVFAVLGLGLWIAALGEDAAGRPRLSAWRIALGSLLIALISGCRPQLLIVIGLGVILFWKSVFHDRTLFSKSSIRSTLALCAPMLAVAAAAMAYNYVRFGSIFDFGANYNLTTNDMRQRGWVWARTFLGVFSYLFQPASIGATFPFIKGIDVQTAYLGKTITETMFGGAVFNNPLLWLSALAFLFRKQIAPRPARLLAVIAPLFAVVLVVVDTQMAGILPRYQSDFTWLLLLSASIVALALYGAWSGGEARRLLLRCMLACFVCCLAYHGLETVVSMSDTVQSNNPAVYYHLQSLIAFWL